jgi:hypothetical protein
MVFLTLSQAILSLVQKPGQKMGGLSNQVVNNPWKTQLYKSIFLYKPTKLFSTFPEAWAGTGLVRQFV